MLTKNNKLLQPNAEDILYYYDGPLAYTVQIDNDQYLIWYLNDKSKLVFNNIVTKISDDLLNKLKYNMISVYDCLESCCKESLWILKAEPDEIIDLIPISWNDLITGEFATSIPRKGITLYPKEKQ